MTSWIVFGSCAAVTLACAVIARRLNWGDAAFGPLASRKLQGSPVPPVGGLAILLVYAVCVAGDPMALDPPRFDPIWGLLLVFGVGALDDVLARGLTPAVKLLLQALALGLATAFLGIPWLDAALLVGLGLTAVNVTNTFDNADGAVAGVAAVGLAFAEPRLAALVLGFGVFNLDARAPWRRGSGVPTAYLGDSGAYVVGLLLLAHGAWAALWIPSLDLLRLSVVRWRAGSRPWIGDRRHLAHRLAARGLSPVGVAAVLAVLTVPGCLGGFLAHGAPLASIPGLVLGAGIYILAVRWTPASK